jgi:DNA repair exonuclease SbcCD ATPase subunit
MKFLTSALHGSFLFFILLFTQVTIVSTLALSGLWLYFKRLKNSAYEEEATNESSVEGNAELIAATNTAKETYLELIRNLEDKVAKLELEKKELSGSDALQELRAEKEKTAELQRVSDEVKGKVQELESKLLEYEILKEEIGELSAIKEENRTLKEDLTRLNEKIAQGQTVAPSVQGELNPSKTIEPAPEKLVEAEAPFVSQMTEVTSSEAETKNNSVIALDTSAAQDDAGLEGLLSEIEALTSEKKELQRKKA